MTGESILDSLEEQRVDISTLANAGSDACRLTLAETNMYFQFTFGVNENMLYYLLKFRGMLLDILDILECSANVRRCAVGEIRVPERALADAKRIFYDLSIFPRPVICPFPTCIFEVFMDVEGPWRIPGTLRVMCPVCQILKNFTSHHYRTDIQAKLVSLENPIGNVYFQNDIELLATLKSRYSGLENPADIWGVLNKLVKWLVLFGIDTNDALLKTYYYRKDLSNFLGRKGHSYPEKVKFI